MNNNYRITNSHTHIYPGKIAQKATEAIGIFYELPMSKIGTAEQLIKDCQPVGVEKYLVCSVATTAKQVVSINDFIISECEKHSEFYGLASMHQDFKDPEEELERVYKKGLKGIKLHHDFQKADVDDERFIRIYKKCAALNMVNLLHAGDDRYEYTRPQKFLRLMEKVPDFKCIAAHFGGYRCWEEAYKVLSGIDNLYFDTSSSLWSLDKDVAVDMIRHFGADKFLFGTDFPMWDAKTELERFMALPLTEEEREMILYKNFYRLFETR